MYILPYRSTLIGSISLSRKVRLLQIKSAYFSILNKQNLFLLEKKEVGDKTLRASSTFKTSHNHTKFWVLERIFSGSLLAVIPLSFAVNSPSMDYIFATAVTLHIHWGIEAIVVDYVRSRVFGPIISKIAFYLVYILSSLVLSGFFYFNYNDVGLTHALRMMWKV